MDIYVKISWISICFALFCLDLDYDFITYIDLPVSQLQTQQLITSQIRSHKIFILKINENLASPAAL